MVWALLLLAVGSLGYHEYAERIPNANRVFSQGGSWPGVGHQLRGGSGPRNPFGVAFHAQNATWTRTLCLQDSDGDGRTNGQELGDENCSWVYNPNLPFDTTGLRTEHITHPGIYDDPYDTCNAGVDIDAPRCDSFVSSGNDTVLMPSWRIPGGSSSDPHQADFYVCKYATISNDRVRHAVKFEPIINHTQYVHHILLFACDQAPTTTSVFDCGSGMPGCGRLIWAWAVGGGPTCLPAEAGFRVGGSSVSATSSPYTVIQIHYFRDAKFTTPIYDSSGVRVHYAPTLRTYDAGMIQLGPVADPNLIRVPPHLSSYTITDGCASECTALMSGSGLRIFNYVVHAHKLGKLLAVQHYNASGFEYEPIVINPFWDFAHQEMIGLRQRTLSPGDELRMKCVYDSTSASTVTLGGESTTNEMCVAFLMYYPNVGDLFNTQCHIDSNTRAYCANLPHPSLAGLPSGYTAAETYPTCPFTKMTPLCLSDADCNGHGACVGVVCACTDGYQGLQCDQAPEFSFSSSGIEANEFMFSAVLFPGKLVMHWSPVVEADGSVVLTVGLEASGVSGWVGVGVGHDMADADTLICSVSSDGAIVAVDGIVKTHDTPQPDTLLGGTDDILGVAGQEVDGVTTCKFRKRFPATVTASHTDKPISKTGATAVIAAFHTTSDQQGTKHSQKVQASVDFLKGSSKVVTWDNRNVHAVLMGVGWGVLVPVAVLIAAAFKHIGHLWYQLHTALQCCAVVLVSAGFGVIVDYVQDDFTQAEATARAHAWLGLVAFLALLINPALGFYANAVYDPQRAGPPVWPDLVHAWVGRVGAVVAFLAIATGIVALDSQRGYIAVLFVWLALLGAVGVVVRRRQHKAQGHKGAEMH